MGMPERWMSWICFQLPRSPKHRTNSMATVSLSFPHTRWPHLWATWCLITAMLNNKSLLSREIFREKTGQNKEQKQKRKSCLQMQKGKRVETTNFPITRNVPGVSSCVHSSLFFFLFLSIFLSLFPSFSASRCTPPMSVTLIWSLSLRCQLRQFHLSPSMWSESPMNSWAMHGLSNPHVTDLMNMCLETFRFMLEHQEAQGPLFISPPLWSYGWWSTQTAHFHAGIIWILKSRCTVHWSHTRGHVYHYPFLKTQLQTLSC